jgi:excisionase family DNA binding protein
MTTQFLNTTEAAELLKVKLSTIYAWIHQRKIPYRKHGARVVFFREDLENWSKSKCVPTYDPSGLGTNASCDTSSESKVFDNQAHR